MQKFYFILLLFGNDNYHTLRIENTGIYLPDTCHNYFTGGFMKSSGAVLILICCLVLNTGLINAQDWTKVRQTIEDTNNKLEKGMIAGDVDQMTAFYTEDAISLPGFEPATRGLAEIKRKTQEGLATGYKISAADFKTTDVIGSGDIAVEVGEWSMTMTMPGNPEAMNDMGKYVTVWQKQSDDTWKIKVETWNTNSNPAMLSEGMNKEKDQMK
jgi:uncharacterized protein (TIGR02246 family)